MMPNTADVEKSCKSGEMTKRTFLLLVLLMAIGFGCAPVRSDQPNVVLIIIDTLRADHLGCYGYSRDTSPVLDSLAASGIRFSRCQAQAPWTLPAHASIWTGLTVTSHMTGNRGGIDYGLDPELQNIATILKEEGYVTLGFVNVVLLSTDFGFANGFDHYSSYPDGNGRAAETVSEVLGWLDENQGNPGPLLIVMHLFDVHAPYDPPGPFDRRFSESGAEGVTGWEIEEGTLLNPEDRDHLLDMYDGEISWVDSELGRFFAELRARGLSGNTLIIVTSDHGEEFLEHGRWGHGHDLYQEQLHVPLIITGPGIPGGVVDSTLAAQIDILPTITGFTGLPIPPEVEGLNLLELHGHRTVPSSGVSPDRCFLVNSSLEDFENRASILVDYRKAIVNFTTGEESMFDLDVDPGENNPSEPSPDLIEALELYWTTPPLGEPSSVTDERIQEDLQGLGYIR